MVVTDAYCFSTDSCNIRFYLGFQTPHLCFAIPTSHSQLFYFYFSCLARLFRHTFNLHIFYFFHLSSSLLYLLVPSIFYHMKWVVHMMAPTAFDTHFFVGFALISKLAQFTEKEKKYVFFFFFSPSAL